MRLNLAVLEQNDSNQLPSEAVQVLKILEQIENHTIKLRNQLMAELKENQQGSIKLELDHI